jgi:site-specific recombinase XerD
MSDLRQIPLWTDDPQTTAEITRHTAFKATWGLFTEHLHKEGKSEHTITAFLGDLHLVAEHLGSTKPVGQFTTSDLNRFLHWLEDGRGVSCSRKSYARRVTTLKVYFKWLHGMAAIPDDPARPVLQRSGPAPLSDVLTQPQIKSAILAARSMHKKDEQDYRPEMLFRLLLDTGIKKSEASRLTPKSIDKLNPDHPMLMVRQKFRNIYKERRIPLDPDWLNLLDDYLMQYQPKEVIFDCTPRNLEYILTAVGEQAEIPFKLSFEVMRWTCAVRDYRMGMDERDLREKLGLSETSWYETGTKIKTLAEQVTQEEARR